MAAGSIFPDSGGDEDSQHFNTSTNNSMSSIINFVRFLGGRRIFGIKIEVWG